MALNKRGIRQVFQSYPRLGAAPNSENPYPTVGAAARAVELLGRPDGSQISFVPDVRAFEPDLPDSLEPAPTVDPIAFMDRGLLSDLPSVPLAGEPETGFRVDAYGRRKRVRPLRESTEIYEDGREVTRAVFDLKSFAQASAAGHTHPQGHSTLPGPEDWSIPVTLNIPLYGVTNAGKWRINPPDKNGRMTVDLIEGRWGRPQEEVDAAIERLNRRLRPTSAGRR